MTLQNKFFEAYGKIKIPYDNINDDIIFFSNIYYHMFEKFPHIISLESDGIYLNLDIVNQDDEYKEFDEDTKYSTFRNVKIQETFCNIIEQYKAICEKDKSKSFYVHRLDEYPIIFYEDENEQKIFFYCTFKGSICVLQNNELLSKEDIAMVKDDNEDIQRYFSYVTMASHGGYDEKSMLIKKFDIDLKNNYNDDLPDEKIKNFLKDTRSGLILLYGAPGSGKTYYIRHLIYTINRPFIVLDASMFNSITDSAFIDLLLENRNAVIILEDCEDMLADRISGNNKLATLLNLSDGIIGDSFNFKFICTFNAKVNQIDKAILRKGRLLLKYEFKALTEDKVQILAEKLGKEIPEHTPLTLSEVYNYNEDNGANTKEKKIGFQK